MWFGVFLVILHSQFSILNLLVTEDDFAKSERGEGVGRWVRNWICGEGARQHEVA